MHTNRILKIGWVCTTAFLRSEAKSMLTACQALTTIILSKLLPLSFESAKSGYGTSKRSESRGAGTVPANLRNRASLSATG